MRKPRFNLIITHEPTYVNYKWARDQLEFMLDNIRIVDTSPSRILAYVDDPYKAVNIIREKIPKDTPILKVIPIDAVTEPYVEDVAKEVWNRAEKIPGDKTFRITMQGHLYWRSTGLRARTIDAINYIAEKINRKVKLKEPDWIIYIKVLRVFRYQEVAAITVTPIEYILSIVKLRSK